MNRVTDHHLMVNHGTDAQVLADWRITVEQIVQQVNVNAGSDQTCFHQSKSCSSADILSKKAKLLFFSTRSQCQYAFPEQELNIAMQDLNLSMG